MANGPMTATAGAVLTPGERQSHNKNTGIPGNGNPCVMDDS